VSRGICLVRHEGGLMCTPRLRRPLDEGQAKALG
jgi:hypothetical protein